MALFGVSVNGTGLYNLSRNIGSAVGISALDDLVTLQATVIAYIDDFKLMMLLCLGALPLLPLFRRAAQPAEADHTIAME